jgi:hypothetical protein
VSHEWIKPAYETRLGNPIAKGVLALIADQMNGEGYGWPSIDFIVRLTEQNKRTVLRVIQVFIEIGLIIKIDRGPRRTPGIQLNTELLGANLVERYAEQFRLAQGKTSGSGKRLRDIEENNVSETHENVSETHENVSETHENVSETFPPHPLLGRPVIDPLKTQPHSPQKLPTSPERIEELRKIDYAVTATTQGCGFTSSRLARIIRKVIQQEADKGEAPATTALQLMTCWQRYCRAELRFKWSASKFFGEGYWNKPESWPEVKQPFLIDRGLRSL